MLIRFWWNMYSRIWKDACVEYAIRVVYQNSIHYIFISLQQQTTPGTTLSSWHHKRNSNMYVRTHITSRSLMSNKRGWWYPCQIMPVFQKPLHCFGNKFARQSWVSFPLWDAWHPLWVMFTPSLSWNRTSATHDARTWSYLLHGMWNGSCSLS